MTRTMVARRKAFAQFIYVMSSIGLGYCFGSGRCACRGRSRPIRMPLERLRPSALHVEPAQLVAREAPP